MEQDPWANATDDLFKASSAAKTTEDVPKTTAKPKKKGKGKKTAQKQPKAQNEAQKAPSHPPENGASAPYPRPFSF